MNRTIALFVALVTLLAHSLAIHSDAEGAFAFPYDQSYVAFRVARNLVFEGQMAWNPGMQAFESHPSFLWVAISAVGERVAPYFHLSMNVFVQTIGIVATLVTVVLCAQFRSDRIASLIAPLFLATSGAVAAAAANGLDTALFTLAVTAAFLALERGHGWRMAIASSVACLTRPEGLIFVFGLLALRLLGRPNDDEGERPRVKPIAFVVPFLVVVASIAVRWRTTGFLLPPSLAALLEPHPGQWREGLESLRDFLLSSASPLLLAFPAWYLLQGALSRTGAHAIFLASTWTAVVALQGRAPLPFGEALVPALPLVFLGIQEGMIVALDDARYVARKVAVVALVGCLIASVLASKSPGDIGPIPFAKVHQAWMRPSGSSRFGYEGPLGRAGLQEEIEHTVRLRRAGLFLRDQVEPILPGARILTPWPGATGYLSKMVVLDVLGRANPLHPADPPRAWSRRERADVVEALRLGADYVVPRTTVADAALTRRGLAEEWCRGLDLWPDETGRVERVETALAEYELVTVPISDIVARSLPREAEPFYLLRARRLDAGPRLEMRVDGGRFHVVVYHQSHLQLADLRLELAADDGRTFRLRPTGELAESRAVSARTRILLYDTGRRGVEVLRGRLPPAPGGARWVEIRARLTNPECEADDPFTNVSPVVALPLSP